jgi:hypothetical protein
MDTARVNGAQPSQPSEVVDGYINKRAVYYSIATCVASVVVVHLVLMVAALDSGRTTNTAIPWQPLVGIALSMGSLISFYLAARRFRVAITASFLLTFLVMMSFALTLPEFAKSTQSEFMTQIQHNFFSVVVAVVGFYFGSEAVVSIAKAVSVTKAPESAAEITRSDRDLAETSTAQSMDTARM